MADDPFASCRLKLTRAKEHANTIEDEILSWVKSEPYSIVKNYDTETRRHIATVVFSVENRPQLTHWSLVLADCIHNLRSSLDHLAYAVSIVKSGKNPPPNKASVQFPISDDSYKFCKSMGRYGLDKFGVGVWTVLESVQPYNRPNTVFSGQPLLSLVRDLENRDKHRLLSVAAEHPIQATIDIVHLAPDTSITETTPHIGPLKNRTEILSFTTSKPTPNMKYDIEAFVVVGLRYGSGVSEVSEVASFGLWLVDEVSEIIDLVTNAVAP